MICNKINIPIVIGAIKNSPAYNCGIRPDDLIVEINKRPIDSTEEAMELLLNNLEDIIEVKINRRGKILAFKMKEKQVDTYPYIFKGRRKVAPFGIFLVGQVHSLSNKDIEYIKKLIIAYRSKRVLLLTSAMIYRHFKYLMKKHGIFDMIKTQTKIAIAKNYFLGGSICAADLLTTEDYIRNIKMQMRTFVPDLIILPCSPFNVWKRDLTGRVNMDIEREIGIPVEFVYNG